MSGETGRGDKRAALDRGDKRAALESGDRRAALRSGGKRAALGNDDKSVVSVRCESSFIISTAFSDKRSDVGFLDNVGFLGDDGFLFDGGFFGDGGHFGDGGFFGGFFGDGGSGEYTGKTCARQTEDAELMRFRCWANVVDGGPTSKQHWSNVL